uniref:TFIIS-type domain-containing protein n=1 Tax=Ditylenchus dipsaci TaxID=166011 RepID=A0A915D8G9_9BILA
MLPKNARFLSNLWFYAADRGKENGYAFTCKSCPYVLPITKAVTSRTYPQLKNLDEVLGGPSAWENAQITDEHCPRCSHDKAYFMQLQTRSADER